MQKYYNRFFTPPQKSFFLFGPRGTGKSTFIQHHYPDALFIDLLFPDVLRNYLARPEFLENVLEAKTGVKTVVIDEVQKAPALLSVIHALIERKKGIQFILTGSSARKLKRTGSDLMAGRALRMNLHSFMAGEVAPYFKLENALQLGMLPLLAGDPQAQATLNSYVDLYLREEIFAEGLVRNLESFARFLEIASFSHGSVVNLSNISRECQVKRKTVENYMEILEELLLAYRLPIFDNRAQRDMSTHPKFYLFDAGVFTTLRPKGPLDRPEEIEGAALEGLVGQHLMAWKDYTEEKYSLSFWRTRSGSEVDFVLYGEKGLWGIEVKNTARVNSADLRGLKAFKKEYPIAKTMLLHRGKEEWMEDGILCRPCENFLLSLKPNHEPF